MAIYTGLTYHIVKGIQRDFHWHPEVEVLFAVEGTSRVTIRNTTFTMKREDVLVINSSMQHRVQSEPDAIVCYIRFPWKLMNDMIGEGSKIFACNSTTDALRSYQKLRSCFQALVYDYVNPSHKTECHQDILMLQILDVLIEEYQIKLLATMGGRVSDDVRIQQIVQYVNNNFQQNISLSSLAEELFVSPSTLSRFFKKQTGIYFVDYVNQVRTRFGLVELLYSDASITEIAVNSGFSNLSVFSRIFKEIYGMTPTDYRRQNKRDSAKESQEQEHLRTELAQRLPSTRQQEGGSQRNVIHADVRAGAPYNRGWNRGINVGFLDQLTQKNLRTHVLMLCQNLGFQYVRSWSVFSKRLMITDGVQIGGYNYGQLDETLDFLVENHIHPWLDLSNRPFTAVKGEGKTVFFEYQCVEFQSREAWEAMVWDFLRHVVKRYGRDEVNQWIFELCCDRAHPEECALYRDEEHPYEFFEAYRYFYRTVKEFAPLAKAGGPGIIAKFDTEFNRGFLLRCVEEGCKPDFISFLMFPYAEERGEDDAVISRRLGNKNAEQEQVAYMRELMQETDTQDCLLYACEWNNSLSNRSFLNDSSYRSAYIARTVNQLWNEVDMGCIRMASDIVGSYYDTYRVANGNMGLVTVGDIRKPAYYAFQFLHSLGAYLVDRGEGYLITRTAHGRFFILCYNYKWFGSSYFLRKEYDTSPSELKGLFEDDEPLELELVLEGLSNHTDYFVNRQVISCCEGSLLYEWSNFQYEDTPESRAYLKQVCFPRMSMVKRPVRNHQLKIQEKLQANEVSLLYICANN